MSDYLHNLVARTFNLIETAQPRLASLFEPPGDFKPVDALQTNRHGEESLRESEEAESPLPSADGKARMNPSSPQANTSLANASGTEGALPAQPSIEDTAAFDVKASRPRLSSVEPGGEADPHSQAPSQSISDLISLKQATHPTVVQPSLQRETQPRLQTGPVALAPRMAGEQISKGEERGRTPGDKDAGRKRVMIEPLKPDEGNPAQPFPERWSQAEARIEEHAKPERPPRILERAMEQRIDELTHTTAESPLFSNQSSTANRLSLSTSQRMKAAAPRVVSALDTNSSSRATAGKDSRAEHETGARRRAEPVIARPQVSRYVETERLDALKQERAPEQVVQVTIGRVEVRAVAASAPAQARANRKSAGRAEQSLAEYLRRRAQGG